MRRLIDTILLFFFTGLAVNQISCTKQTTEAPLLVVNSIYSNSFENASDTVGWQGYGAFVIFDEGAPGAGNHSLLISGGCVVPHAYFEIAPQDEEGYYTVQAWGKLLEHGGSVSLERSGNAAPAFFQVIENSWVFYTSDTLFCPANELLTLSLMSGGFIPGSMLVDQIEVIKLPKGD